MRYLPLLLLLAAHVHGAVWTSAGSPYHVTDTLAVAADETLTIEAGVDVIFDADVPINIDGRLVTHGTETDSVRFYPGVTDHWTGLRLRPRSSAKLSYTALRGAKGRRESGAYETYAGGIGANEAVIDMDHCVVAGNVTEEYGGGIYAYYSNISLVSCTIRGNEAERYAGGILVRGRPASLSDCLLEKNIGGGFEIRSSSATLTNCVIRENTATSGHSVAAAGVSCHGGRATLVGCEITDNTNASYGGGVGVESGSSLEMIRCLIARNSADNGAALWMEGVWNDPGTLPVSATLTQCTITEHLGFRAVSLFDASLRLEGCIVYELAPNPVSVTYSKFDAQYSCVWGTSTPDDQGNINANPRFTNPAHGDYSLLGGSPCIDTGSPYYRDADGTPANMGWTGGRELGDVPRIAVHAERLITTKDHAARFEIENLGGASLTVELDVPEGFETLPAFPQVIPSGGSMPVYVRYLGGPDVNATLTLTHDDAFQPEFVLPVLGAAGIVAPPYPRGTWSKKNSPYRMLSDVTVLSGETLIIEPGVDIIWHTNAYMHVWGTLHTRGTATDSVRFLRSSADAGAHVSIDSPDSCSFTFTRFSCLTSPFGLSGQTDIHPHHLIEDVVFQGNEPTNNMIYTFRCDVTMRRCRIQGNTLCEDDESALIYARNTSLELEHCLITRNDARDEESYAVWLHWSLTSASFEFCTIADNFSGQRAAIYTDNEDQQVRIASSIVWGNGADLAGDGVFDVSYSDVGSAGDTGWEPLAGIGNLSVDPLFADTTTYTLAPGSPCVDAGSPYALDADSTRADMGLNGGTGGAAEVPTISVPASVNVRFGTGGELVVSNTGNAELRVDSLAFTGPFATAVTFPVMVAVNTSVGIPLTCTVDGYVDGAVVVYHNDIYQPSLSVILHGAPAGTEVSGEVAGVWTSQQSPYLVVGRLTVPEGDTLRIEPGVDVFFDVDADVTVRGVLHAVGEPGDSIRFRSGLTERWGGIRFGGGDSSVVAWCRISGTGWTERATYPADNVECAVELRDKGTRLRCERVVFTGNQARPTLVLIHCDGGTSVDMEECTFAGNTVPDDWSSSSLLRVWGSATLRRCLFDGGYSDVWRPAVEFTFGGPMLVEECTFRRFNNATNGVLGSPLLLSLRTPGVVRKCVFEDNGAGEHFSGLGMSYGTNPLVSAGCNMRIRDNQIAGGADQLVRFEECRFVNNDLTGITDTELCAAGDSTAHVVVSDCVFSGSDLSEWSDAVVAVASTLAPWLSPPEYPDGWRRPFLHVVNSVIVANSLQAGEGPTPFGDSPHVPAVVTSACGILRMTNCTVVGPGAPAGEELPAATVLVRDGSGRIVNTIIRDGGRPGVISLTGGYRGVPEKETTFHVQYSDMPGGYPGTGNIDADPMFVDSQAGDYSLLSGSPCRDTGDPDLPADTDGSRSDMGANSLMNPILQVEESRKPGELTLYPAYPNPFNPSTTIRFDLPEQGRVRLAIYNVHGQMVRLLVDRTIPAGSHIVSWHGDDDTKRSAGTGVYLCRLQSGSESRVQRLTLVR